MFGQIRLSVFDTPCVDLSFNNIEVIEGLDELTKLEDLALSHNRIQKIENLDKLTELHVLCIGDNELKDLSNVCMPSI